MAAAPSQTDPPNEVYNDEDDDDTVNNDDDDGGVVVQMALARPVYRVGGTVVGTILCTTTPTTAPPTTPNENEKKLDTHGPIAATAAAATAATANATLHNPRSPPPPPRIGVRIRDRIRSLQLSAAGFGRLDPRWHKPTTTAAVASTAATTSKTKTATPAPAGKGGGDDDNDTNTNTKRFHNDDDDSATFSLPLHTTPFWTTERPPLELMALPERSGVGSWEAVRPQPIVAVLVSSPPGRQSQQKVAHISSSSRTSSNQELGNQTGGGTYSKPTTTLLLEEDRRLAFSFRIELPKDAPHSLVATSCRYYYLISVRLVTVNVDGCDGDRHTEWIHLPIKILTASPLLIESIPLHSPSSSSMQAMSHSSGLPTLVTATELHQWQGQVTVCGRQARQNTKTVQSMRIEDPKTGRPICILTILGNSPSQLYPGSQLILKFDFPRKQRHRDDNKCHERATTHAPAAADTEPWMPCVSVSSCLQGEEMAICNYNNTTTRSTPPLPKKVRARRYVFDTAHESIDGTTECVPLTLSLPETAPCSVATASLEIRVFCVVDIGIPVLPAPRKNRNNSGADAAAAAATTYRNLRLEFPCRVMHDMFDWEIQRDEEGMESSVPPMAVQRIREIYESNDDDEQEESVHFFQSQDIQSELKILSLDMAAKSGLIPLRP